MVKLRRDEQGIGMIEVLAAILLVAIGIVGTLQAFISGDHANLATQRARKLGRSLPFCWPHPGRQKRDPR